MIELEHVTKLYGSIPGLRDVSLHVPAGQIVGLLGRNGAGKTTALNLMTGYFPPTEGRIRVGGKDMIAEPRECKRMIGYLPEKPPLYDEMTVEEYLSFVSELREVARKANKEHVNEIIELCALKEVRILDEPTVGLDPRQTVERRELVRKLGKDHTVVFSSHILSEVQQLCSRVIILNEGRMVQSIDLTEKTGDTVKLRVRAAGRKEALLGALKGLQCVIQAETAVSPEAGTAEFLLTCRTADEQGKATDQIFRLMAGLNAPIRMMTEEKDTLEAIFLRETE